MRNLFLTFGALLVLLVLLAVVRMLSAPSLQQQLAQEQAARDADQRRRDETTAQARAETQPAIDAANAQQLADYHEQRQARIAQAEQARANERGVQTDSTYEAQRAALQAAQASPGSDPQPTAAPDPEPVPAETPRARSPIRRDPKTVGVADQGPEGDGAEKRPAEQIATPTPAAPTAKPSYAITLKDGRTIDALQLVDAGDVYSVKTTAGKFVTLQKADVADVPAALLPKR